MCCRAPWTLGLGCRLSARADASALALPAAREWLRWLDRLQKSVVARSVGEPVRAFVHDHDGASTARSGGTIRASYGSVTLEANLGPACVSSNGQAWLPGANPDPARGRSCSGERLGRVATRTRGAESAHGAWLDRGLALHHDDLVMKTQSPDTSPEAERVLIEWLRRTPAWRRLQLADRMSATVRDLCLAGIRSRHPHASAAEVRRQFADLHLGPELAAEVFGPAG